jgi:hypothetical protein
MSGFLPRSQIAIEKKFESVVWHHENVVKLAQHHQLAPGALPHVVLDGIIEHVTAVAKKKNLVPFVTFASNLFQIEVSHLYSPATNEFTLILQVHRQISLQSATHNLFKQFPALICMLVFTLETPSFAKGGK